MFLFIMAILLAAGAVGLLAGFGSDYLTASLSGKVSYQLRTEAFTRIQRLSLKDFEKFGIGTLASRFSQDIPAIGTMTSFILPAIFKSGLSVAAGVILLLQMQWKLTLLLLVCSAVLFASPLLLKQRSKLASEQFKEAQESFIDLVDESVKSRKMIRGFRLAELMEKRAKPRIDSIWNIGMRMNLLFSLMERIPATSLLILSAVMIGAGGYLIFQDELTIGAFVAMNTIFLMVGQSIFTLSLLWPQLFEAEVSLSRVNALLSLHPKEETDSRSQALPEAIQDIHFHNVSFGYTAEQRALNNVSLTVPAGSLTVFVGPSGSGKSTALQLLLHFFKPTSGAVTFGEKDLHREISERSLYEQVAVVFQDSQFLRMSVKDNLMLGNANIDMEAVQEAAKLAQIHETIVSMPEQYETIIQDGGNHLSGGQRQRLAIARALAKHPKYVLLDEASSALDPANESEINHLIAKLRGSKTVISVTHRLASAVTADCIHVFQNGEIVESGTHAELLRREGVYKQLWDKQSGFVISDDGFEAKVETARLARFPFFHGIDASLLEDIGKQFVTEKYDAGQRIVQEGQEGDKFYLIARGSVEVLKGIHEREEIIATLQDGDHFGEIALLRNIPRTATIRAKVPSILLSLRRNQLLELARAHREIYDVLERTLEERMSS